MFTSCFRVTTKTTENPFQKSLEIHLYSLFAGIHTMNFVIIAKTSENPFQKSLEIHLYSLFAGIHTMNFVIIAKFIFMSVLAIIPLQLSIKNLIRLHAFSKIYTIYFNIGKGIIQ
jgi:hypothetical protein